MKWITPLAFLALLASPAFSETWKCLVPYDEVNGGGSITIQAERLVFVSDWPHREPEILKCTRSGLISECMSADLSVTGEGSASVFAKLYSIIWQRDGAPTTITTRQLSAIFKEHEDGYAMAEVFPAIGYKFPVTDCKLD
ncbi:hypothetical protein SAMN05444414_1128 [Roseovarius marisflavi]|uniref:Uncharacterized protein n=1 Tax=Roseovarius marisflavi TaxID=1054996 RepID=A0A1M7A2A1_9RHOB|nr:hypothetical protein [Roseovarius marisflavi]SHL36892.1 hypothetical protein SAMN05444414_1128 [Roseovarius marisflavi]